MRHFGYWGVPEVPRQTKLPRINKAVRDFPGSLRLALGTGLPQVQMINALLDTQLSKPRSRNPTGLLTPLTPAPVEKRAEELHGSNRAPVTVFIDQPSSWSQTLQHASDRRLLFAGEPKQYQTRTNQIELTQA